MIMGLCGGKLDLWLGGTEGFQGVDLEGVAALQGAVEAEELHRPDMSDSFARSLWFQVC